eukprot:188725-Amphidinium_carterae.1
MDNMFNGKSSIGQVLVPVWNITGNNWKYRQKEAHFKKTLSEHVPMFEIFWSRSFPPTPTPLLPKDPQDNGNVG